MSCVFVDDIKSTDRPPFYAALSGRRWTAPRPRISVSGPVWGLLALLVMLLMAPLPLWGGAESSVESTMMMFVGEEIDVLSIASRREESAWQAPAIAEVISRKELRERGVRTLGEALSTVSGFYMAEKEWGTLPYLRGIANSILFLYDTVPLNADSSKSLNQLDSQLSLGPVKRVEIIRGAGSVLWGPDAFAGIVNIVPLTGRDVGGVETEAYYASGGDQAGATLTMGDATRTWDALLSIDFREGDSDDDRPVNLVRFWDDSGGIYLPEDRMGEGELSDERYLDIFGRLAWEDYITLSGRFWDNHKAYTASRPEEDVTWQQALEIPGGFVKLEAKNDIGSATALRLTGYYSRITPTSEVIDQVYRQTEETVYGELICDHKFNYGRTLLTGGVSYREKQVADADEWVDYLPDFLGSDNESTVPQVSQEDYEAAVWSVFSQIGQKIGPLDLAAGVRYDRHDIYDSNTSYSITGVYPFLSQWNFKCVLGTAYRTPYARQLIEVDVPDLEKIKSLSLQLNWAPSKNVAASVTGFRNRIENHIQSSAYANLSTANDQEIEGIELQARATLFDCFELAANYTAIRNSGPQEVYHFLGSYLIWPDGTIEGVYEDYSYDFDTGPETLFNLTGTWRGADTTLYAGISYAGAQDLVYFRDRNLSSVSYPERWIVNAAFERENLLPGGVGLGVTVRNATDVSDAVPGDYSAIETDPLKVVVTLRKEW